MRDTGWPFWISYVPGHRKFQSGNLKAWRSLAGSGPIHGCLHSANAGVPHFRSAVTLAGVPSAVFTSPTGCPDHQGRLPIWPIRITITSTRYIAYARVMRPGESMTSRAVRVSGVSATPRAGRSEPPITGRGAAAGVAVPGSVANSHVFLGLQTRSN